MLLLKLIGRFKYYQMLPNGMKDESIQLGIRLDKKVIDDIDFVAKHLGYDRNFLIKKMIREELNDLKKDIREDAVNDYLDFRITEQEYFDILGEKPEDDLRRSRKENMTMILEEKQEKRRKEA